VNGLELSIQGTDAFGEPRDKHKREQDEDRFNEYGHGICHVS